MATSKLSCCSIRRFCKYAMYLQKYAVVTSGVVYFMRATGVVTHQKAGLS